MSTARRLIALLVLAYFALVAGAGAAGAPVPTAVSGKAGVVTPGGTERFYAVRSGSGTVVRVVARGDGRVLRSARIAGRWTIPAVTMFGATTGLSGDGRTLLLARPMRNYPASRTRLAVVDAASLRVRREITLPGFLTVDAISPDGRTAFVIQYRDPNALDYRVRALDTGSGRLVGGDVTDPRKPGEQMAGLPMKRLMSPDGRWAYTLYGGGSETFIHALDTVGRTAACIDLEMIPTDSDFTPVGMSLRGGNLLVRDDHGLVATVDRGTFAVRDAAEAAAPAQAAAVTAPVRRAVPAAEDGGGFPWPEVLLIAVGLCAIGLGAARALSGPRAETPPRA